MNKEAIRRTAIEQRDNTQFRVQKSAKIQTRLESHPTYQAAQCIFVYVNIRSEVRTIPLIDQLIRSGSKSVLIPFCRNDDLEVFHLKSWEQLERRSFGILEPNDSEIEKQGTEFPTPELALIPGTGFDQQRNRIGYGRGHFDRFIQSQIPDVYRIGLAFEDQLFEELPLEPHDIPMDEIVTDSGIIF